MRRLLPLLLPALLGAGWRGAGDGVFPGATPPEDWHTARWRTELPGWGNATPVRVADLVCVTREPITLVCLDATTGAVRWTRDTTPVDAVPEAERSAAAARAAAARAADAALLDAQREWSRLRRDLRRDPSDAHRAAVEALTAHLAELRAAREAGADLLLPDGDTTVGWSTPTPTADAQRVCTSSSLGLVVCFAHDGTRLWTRDLGRPTPQRRGYTGVPTASPQLVGDVLVVAHDRLLGLDAATGETLWDAGPHLDFGTPARVGRGAEALLATADGRLVRADDGTVLSTELGDGWYNGALAVGDVVYRVSVMGMSRTDGPGTAGAWRIVREGRGARVEPLWQTPLPTDDRLYADPVLWGDALVAVSKAGEALVLDAADGSVRHHAPLDLPTGAEVWASPTVADGRLFVPTDRGSVLVFRDASLAHPVRHDGTRMLAAPVFDGDVVYLHRHDALVAVGP